MLFFRSEEHVREWCARSGYSVQPCVSLPVLWRLAMTWYATRLRRELRKPSPADMRALFGELGLVGEFWNPEAKGRGPSGGGA